MRFRRDSTIFFHFFDRPDCLTQEEIVKYFGIEAQPPTQEASPNMSEKGKSGSDQRWAPHRKFLEEASKLADEKWAKGDDALHNEMADWLLNQDRFKDFRGKESCTT